MAVLDVSIWRPCCLCRRRRAFSSFVVCRTCYFTLNSDVALRLQEMPPKWTFDWIQPLRTPHDP